MTKLLEIWVSGGREHTIGIYHGGGIDSFGRMRLYNN